MVGRGRLGIGGPGCVGRDPPARGEEGPRETHPAGPVARAWEEGGEAGADLISIAQVVKRGRVWKKKKVLGGNSAEV